MNQLDEIIINLNPIPFFVAFIVTLGITPIVKKVALTLKVLDHPNTRKIHHHSVPLLGSIAVYLGILAALGVSQWSDPFQREVLIIFLSGTFLLIIGILDDWGLLHPQIKLMVAMPVAALILIYFDSGLKLFPINFLNYFFTLFWIVGITAAYNLLDGMDGLSTGVCLIASFFYLMIGMAIGDRFLIFLSLSLMGACLAFLIYNFYPAKIFLGDSGAILLGFLLSSLGLRVANTDSLPVFTRWMLPILILTVPIFDTSLITLSRARRGLMPFLHPGKDHSHHRLYNLGLGQRKTVLIIYLLGIIGGFFSLMIYRLSTFSGYIVFGFLIFAGLTLLFLFEKLPFERQEFSKGRI
ncbi:MAG: MraY family glycosyltransferase [Thermodesulfobacteriota bacterium]